MQRLRQINLCLQPVGLMSFSQRQELQDQCRIRGNGGSRSLADHNRTPDIGAIAADAAIAKQPGRSEGALFRIYKPRRLREMALERDEH